MTSWRRPLGTAFGRAARVPATAVVALLAFVLVCIGIVILRRTSPEIERPFRTPFVPWFPILGAIICLVQMVALPWSTWERLIVWMGIGIVVYFAYGYSHSEVRKRDTALAAAGGTRRR